MIPLHEQLPAESRTRLRLATCTAVGSGTATITLGGTSISEVPYIAQSVPVQGDTVFVFQDGSALLILGSQV